MSNDKFDAETNQALAEAEALEGLFQSSGWSIAERELNDVISALRDTRTVPRDGDILLNLEVRDKTAAALEEWVASLKSMVNNAIIMQEQPDSAKMYTRR